MVSVCPNLFCIFCFKENYILPPSPPRFLHTVSNLDGYKQQSSNSKVLIGGVNHAPRNEETLSGINLSKVVRLSK